jgi:hypothetical protein
LLNHLQQPDTQYTKIVDRYARYIESPVLRLKFLNAVMKSKPQSGLLMRLPFIGALPERARLITELAKVLPLQTRVPFSLRLTAFLYKIRFAVYGLSAILVLAASVGLVYVGSKAVSGITSAIQAKPASPAASDNANDGAAVAAIGSEAGLPLDKVWLAEKTDTDEFYSNGARILTEYETGGARRTFYRFDVDKLGKEATDFEMFSKPVGIVYHLTESDLLPFSDNYNKSLIRTSEELMDYARRHKLYNYLIDRFGRIFRIVRDEDVAYHAGNSIWSDARHVYINLNSSFIGISFEGKSGIAKGADGINEAQIYAARVLTAVLRSKYQINDVNCTTHGLVSTNPSSRLLGHHTDWVANFPFEAVGLTNKYNTEMYAISRFGFAYDQSYITAAGGKRWQGLMQADSALWEAAKRNGFVIEQQRRALWESFEQAYAKQHEIDKQRIDADTPEVASGN